MENSHSGVGLILVSVLLMAVIFIIDVNLPLGVAGGVPYIAVILIALWLDKKSYVVAITIICILLVLLGFYLSPSGGVLWQVVANRLVAIMAICVTAFLALKWRSTQQRIFNLLFTAKQEQAKQDIYFATMNSSQHIIYNLINQLQLVRMEIERHPTFSPQVVQAFDEMTEEAQSLLQKLSSVTEIDAEKIRNSVSPKLR